MEMSDNISSFVLSNSQPFVQLDCETAFNALTLKEKLYAHYLSQAAWNGGLTVFLQTSPEAPLIFALLHKLYLAEGVADLNKAAVASGITQDEFTAFLAYTCGIFSNFGNYKGLGDTKIIPNLPMVKFEIIVKSSKAYDLDSANLLILWDRIKHAVYSIEDKVKALGFGDKGVTTYFSLNCDENDAKIVNEFMQWKRLEFYNTRCFKTHIVGDKVSCRYEIRLASTESGDNTEASSQEEYFKNAKFTITKGDYDLILLSVVENLKMAKEYAANPTEVNMINKYIEHFTTGCSEEHKNACRFWITNKAPAVETFIGFLESYRDPAGQRGEYEAFVGMVNRPMSDKFAALVDHAEKFIATLPWGQNFEKDKFLMPDFTSIDILTISGSVIYNGKTVPNYSEMRQSEGFKNLSLGNVIFANAKQDKFHFLSEADQELMKKYGAASFEMQVGLHELLGHGSGKLLRKLDDGSFNFDLDVMNPLTGEPVTSYYVGGETYNSVFGPLASPWEECKSEAVGLYLSLNKDVVKIFGFEGSKADDVIYVNWLSLLWNGFAKALTMYQPSTKKWSQAHSQARYVLLRVCLEAGENFVKLVETEPGKNLRLTVDRSKLYTVGKKTIGDFLKKLQLLKSIADVNSAKEIFNKYSEVPESGPYPWAKWRNIIMSHQQPRKIFVQPNTSIDSSGAVTLKSYEPTFEGFIQSWIDRFPSPKVSDALIGLYEKDAEFFVLPGAKH